MGSWTRVCVFISSLLSWSIVLLPKKSIFKKGSSKETVFFVYEEELLIGMVDILREVVLYEGDDSWI